MGGNCNSGILNIPGCTGQYYEIYGKTGTDGYFRVDNFNWTYPVAKPISLGWWKPTVSVSLPSGYNNLVQDPNAVYCSRGADTVAGNNNWCHDPENVCGSGNGYYNSCNLSGKNLPDSESVSDRTYFDFEFRIAPYVQGDVTYGSNYYSPSCSACSGKPCTASAGLSVSCSSVSTTWGCYSNWGSFTTTRRTDLAAFSCTATNPPSGYRYSSWQLTGSSGQTSGSCSNPTSCTVSITPDYGVGNTGQQYLRYILAIIPPASVTGKFVDASSNQTCGYVNSTPGNVSATIRLTKGGGPNYGPATGTTFNFNPIEVGTYTINTTPPAGFINPGSLYCKSNSAFPNIDNVTVGASENVTLNIGLIKSSNAWWQTQYGDILANSIKDPIPSTCSLPSCPPYVSLSGTAGSSGVIAYKDAYDDDATAVNSGSPSQTAPWLVKQNPTVSLTYADLEKRVPQDQWKIISSGSISTTTLRNLVPDDGETYFLKYSGGNLTITGSSLSLGNRKMALFVTSGNLTFNLNSNQTVNFNDGVGFAAFIASHDINISPNISGSSASSPGLEGIYFAGNTINTGTKGSPTPDSHLWVRGSLVGLSGITFQRDLDPNNSTGLNNGTPAETVIFAPELFFTFPEQLRDRNYTWEQIPG